ncbi:MAG TPA: class I SAM-dependent methyltransferase [Desulfobacterales bacterium]|nr:class I SAM-dependent methyltransferase [Desulfobacterales bacterium]
MPRKKTFYDRYKDNDTPWEINRFDRNLREVVDNAPVSPGRAIEIGCGTGDNAVWLASRGFVVTACDSVQLAIQRAEKKAGAIANCSFYALDFLNDEIPDAPFDFAFDRGCFHTIDEGEARRRFVEKVALVLGAEGRWLSVIGNADGGKHKVGPPQLTAAQVTAAVEPSFEILSLTAAQMDIDMASSPRCWLCLMKKR